jgi:hypothetical protein
MTLTLLEELCFILWDKRGAILEHGHMINYACYVEALKKLKTQVSRVRPEKKGIFLLQHDNAKDPYQHHDKGDTVKFGWTVLPQLLYGSDLMPLDFHQFGPVKDGLLGKHFADDNVVIMAITKVADSSFYKKGMQALVHS